jgi:hypothetical protein
MPSPWDIVKPDLGPLHRALTECRVAPDQIPHVAIRLSRPPLSLGQLTTNDPAPLLFGGSTTTDPAIFSDMEIQIGIEVEAGLVGMKPHEFDGDMAARMLRLSEGRPDPNITWKMLSRAERKRAKRLWDWVGRAHGLSVTPQGRPPVVDPALVLYCTRVLCEATGRHRFGFSRIGGAFGGPMWRALIEALRLAQSFLAYRFTPAPGRISTKERDPRIDSHLEAIAEVVRATRSKRFSKFCQLQGGFELTSEGVARSPSMFRLAIAYTRHLRPQCPRRSAER